VLWGYVGVAAIYAVGYPTSASHRLNGSALGLGIDWISRNADSVLTASD
jgi:hypothetical protein